MDKFSCFILCRVTGVPWAYCCYFRVKAGVDSSFDRAKHRATLTWIILKSLIKLWSRILDCGKKLEHPKNPCMHEESIQTSHRLIGASLRDDVTNHHTTVKSSRGIVSITSLQSSWSSWRSLICSIRQIGIIDIPSTWLWAGYSCLWAFKSSYPITGCVHAKFHRQIKWPLPLKDYLKVRFCSVLY